MVSRAMRERVRERELRALCVASCGSVKVPRAFARPTSRARRLGRRLSDIPAALGVRETGVEEKKYVRFCFEKIERLPFYQRSVRARASSVENGPFQSQKGRDQRGVSGDAAREPAPSASIPCV